MRSGGFVSVSRPVITFIVLILSLYCFHVFALKSQLLTRHGGVTDLNAQDTVINYETCYFDQKIDHFGFLEDGTFKQRYLVNNEHWDQKGGPILFYTGNEGDITWFCNNTGFMWDVAEDLGAMLVFAEHRYYGESLPFGQDSYSQDTKHLNYLTSEQALADFSVLIRELKRKVLGAQESPVIAIGGSYGGMLSAWLRMKYPNVVVGALAASAPIWQFPDMVPCGDFYKIVTQDFARSGLNCDVNIRRSWKAIDNITATDDGLQWLSGEFSLCSPLKKTDLDGFKAWLQETWVNLAMVDYPYEANFLQPLPRWPIKVVCKHLSFDPSSVSDYQLLGGISEAARVYYNYTGNCPCLNTSSTATGNLGSIGWYYQACTEMVMPLCTDGVQDMFERQDWNFQAFSDECNSLFGVRPRADWAATVYGGLDIGSHSNIIFRMPIGQAAFQAVLFWPLQAHYAYKQFPSEIHKNITVIDVVKESVERRHLQALIRPYTKTRALRSSTSGLLASLPLRKYSSRSAQSKLFAALAPQWWNKHPHDARTAESITTFRRHLKRHLFKEYLG
ncbi:lysosomal Pro-X carboxypeptidase isoform X2 [Oncorhynchus nerka]|uniref:lysosomal Pro-X carboxypeptidase isoform X2 n=1 Tax=Oncorhynchus nerka TaxID=8023 RepID=UPI0031B873D8